MQLTFLYHFLSVPDKEGKPIYVKAIEHPSKLNQNQVTGLYCTSSSKHAIKLVIMCLEFIAAHKRLAFIFNRYQSIASLFFYLTLSQYFLRFS